VHRKRHQDRLNKALGQADVAGLRAVRPAGFMTKIPPKRGEPSCSIALIPLKWRIDSGDRHIPVPFSIKPVLGGSFRSLFPGAIPAAQALNALVAECIPYGGALRLPAGTGLKLALESAPRKPSRKGMPRKLPRNRAPFGFIRPELTGVDISGRPHVSYALAHALPPAPQPALAMSLRAISAQSAPALTARTEGFAEVRPSAVAMGLAGTMREDFPRVPTPAPVRLPLLIETRTSASLFSNGLETRSCYPEVQAIAGTRLPHAGPLPFSVNGVAGLPTVPRLGIEIASAPAIAARAEGFAAIAPAEPAQGSASAMLVESPTVPSPAVARLPLPLRTSLPDPALKGEDKACPIFYSKASPASAAARADIEPLSFGVRSAARRVQLELGLEIEVESAQALATRTEGFAAVALREAAPNSAYGLAIALPVVSRSTPIRLPRPMAASQSALAVASDSEVRRLSCLGIELDAATRGGSVTPWPVAAATGAPRLPTEVGLQIAIESSKVLAARAEGFADIAPDAIAPNGVHGAAVELPLVPGSAPVLPRSIAALAHTPRLADEAAALPISQPEVRSAAAVDLTLTATPRPSVAPDPQLAIDLATTFAAPAEDFAVVSPKGATPSQASSLTIEQSALPGPTPLLLPPPVETTPHAPALARETAALPISYPEGQAAVAAMRPGVEPSLFALVARPPRLPGEPGLQIQVESAPAMAAPAEGFSAVTALFPSGAAPRPVDDNLAASDCEKHPPGEADLFPLEYFCQRSRIIRALHGEWTQRAIPRVLPELPFDKVLGAIEDLLPEKDAAKPFFAGAPKVETRRWGGRYLELAAAAIVLATVLGTGLHIATRLRTQTPNERRDVAALRVNAAPAPIKPASGPLSQIRNAIANRAALEISDTFRAGMEAWGHVKALAPGWKLSPDGYVRPGQLALFQPSMKFTDYRMEFFGQIESKSIDWVVRAHDLNNFYAMKFTVIDKGLRPVIAVVHYPVVGGKPGRRSTVPLSVMVHNNEPYRIDVSVNGSLVVTSIEGQEVDRWNEDSVRSGGVGFFSEADERARVYWMKVAKNEDFLGRLCAYITGGSSTRRDEAMLFPQGFQPIRRSNQGVIHGFEFFTAKPHSN
jgi:hypothetical protein